ncbi:hypothetical protein [Paracoccus sp. ME4]|uniref:hypothetical protein n=1 Tax=Paracoccus sp. ME4 TaxID=3138066 RepID=UPI00398B96F9
MTDFDNAAHLHMHQVVKAFKSGDREHLGELVMRILATGDLDGNMIGMAQGEMNEKQFESFRSYLRSFVCESRMTTDGGQRFDFGVFGIPYQSAEPLGPFLSNAVRNALVEAMRSCALFDAGSQVFLMERILNPIEVGMISESAIFEYGLNTAMMVASDMVKDAELAAVDLVSDIDPFPPMPMTVGLILGVRVQRAEADASKALDRVFFGADYELDDEDFPWNDQWKRAVSGLMSSHSIRFTRPRPWTWAPRPQVDLGTEPEEKFEAADPVLRLVEAALPFATAGLNQLEVRPGEDGGWVWGGKEQNQRIHTWFGPSEFGNLMAALEDFGVHIPVGEDG